MSALDLSSKAVYWDDIGYALKLEWQADRDPVFWVNWKLYEIQDDAEGARMFCINGAMPSEGTIDQADHCAEGSCQYDGSLHGDLELYFDDRSHIDLVAEALHRIYDEVGEIVGHEYIKARS